MPYVTGKRTRVLKPKLAEHSWEVVGEYMEPMMEAWKAKPAAASSGPDNGREALDPNKTVIDRNMNPNQPAVQPGIRPGGRKNPSGDKKSHTTDKKPDSGGKKHISPSDANK